MPSVVLDLRLEELREESGRTWGGRDAALALLLVPFALVLPGQLLAGLGLPTAAAAAGSSAALAAVAVVTGRRIAAQSGGWERALGFDAPLWSDGVRIVRWTVGLLLLQAVLVGLLSQVVPGLSAAQASNTEVLREQSLTGLLHVTGANASSLLVVVGIVVLALGLSLLTRRTGRLGPAIGVHALHNAVAVLAVALTR